VLVHMLKYPESDEMLRYVNLIRSISGTDNEDMEALRSTMRDALSEDEKQEIDELEALSKDKSDNIKPGSRSGVQLYSTEKCMGL
jgi:pantothenate synthetase